MAIGSIKEGEITSLFQNCFPAAENVEYRQNVGLKLAQNILDNLVCGFAEVL